METMRILVVGATGMLGAPVAQRLAAEGFAVRALVRDAHAARARLDSAIEAVTGDVTRPETLAPALEGCDGLYVSLRGRNDVASYEAIEVNGVRNLAAAAARTGRVQRLIYISGAGRTAGNERHFPVRIKAAAEAAIRASGVPFTILRATHFMESLPLFVRGRRATVLGRQPHRYHYLAAADYARMVAQAFREPRAAGRTLTALGPAAYTMAEALAVFTRSALSGVQVDSLPLPLARLIARLTGNRDLRFAAELFAAFAAIGEEGDAAEANALLGAPAIELEQWCREWARAREVAA